LLDKIRKPCHRSIYVLGPYRSEYSDTAVSTSNAIAIASGIGITPTLALMTSYAGKKRINIMWMCRDAGLLEYMLHKADFSTVTQNSFAFVYYTGTRDLVLPKTLPTNLFVFRRRPHLEETITSIIAAIDSGDGLPEDICKEREAMLNQPFSRRVKAALERVITIYSKEDMFAFAVKETDKELANTKHIDDLEGSTFCSDYLEYHPLFKCSKEISREKNVVSLEGLESMISHFLGGVGEYSKCDIVNLFNQADVDGSGFIDEEDFDLLFSQATEIEDEKAARPFLQKQPSVARGLSRISSLSNISLNISYHNNYDIGDIGDLENIGDLETIEYVEDMINNVEKPLDDWSVFYCGTYLPM
jgi:hypothetical protein